MDQKQPRARQFTWLIHPSQSVIEKDRAKLKQRPWRSVLFPWLAQPTFRASRTTCPGIAPSQGAGPSHTGQSDRGVFSIEALFFPYDPSLEEKGRVLVLSLPVTGEPGHLLSQQVA